MPPIAANVSKSFVNISNPRPGTVACELKLQLDGGVDDVRHSPLSTEMVNFQAFNRRQLGATGAATYESASVPIDLSQEPNSIGRAFIGLSLQLAQIKILNDADEFKFSYLGNDYTLSVTAPAYLVQSGVRTWVSQSFADYTLNRVITLRANQRSTTAFTLGYTSSFPDDVASTYIAAIRNVGTVSYVNPNHRILGVRGGVDVGATDFTNPNIEVDIAIGGGKSGNVLTYTVPITLLNPPVTRPDIPNFEPVQVEINRAYSEIEGQITVDYTITPTLTSRSGGLIEMTLSETRPIQRDIGNARTANLLDTSLTRAGIERGKSYKIIVVWKAGGNVNHFSEAYYFRYGDEIIQESDVDHLAQQVKAAKIFIAGFESEAFQFEVIQDIFLSDFVDAIRVDNLGDTPVSNVKVTNDRTSSVISINHAARTTQSPYSLAFVAETQYGDVEIARGKFSYPGLIPSGAVSPQKTAMAIKHVVYRAYDSDILEIVEALPQDCQLRIVEMQADRLNNPTNDGRLHDFNKFNKRGSIFGKTNSDLSKTKYSEVVDTALGDISAIVPDIDAGSPY